MDPEIQRAIEEIQYELRELILVMRNLGNVMSALGDQELKIDEFNNSLDQSSKKVKQFTGLVDENGNAIRAETEAREEAADATRELTLEERRRRAEEFVYRRSQRSAFRDLTQELSTTRGATARLQEGLFKQIEGNEILQSGALLLESAFRGLGKATTSLMRDLYSGQRGAQVSAKAIDELGQEIGTALQGIGLALAAFSLFGTVIPQVRILGVTVKIASKAFAGLAGILALLGIGIKTATEVNKAAAEQNDRLFKAYNALSKGAVGVTGGLDGLFDSLQTAGLTVAEIESFASQLTANAKTLAFLGATSGDAAKAFVGVAGTLRKSELGRELELLGIQSEEQREGVLSYLSLQARLGRQETRITTDLIGRTSAYIKQLDRLAQITGTTVKEQQEARERQMTDERYRAAIVAARNRGDQAELARLERAGQLAAAVEAAGDQAGAQGILQIAAGRGALTTPEAVAAEMTYGVNAVLNSQASVEDSLRMLVDQGKITQARFADINALIGTVSGIQTPVVALADVIDRTSGAFDRARELGITIEELLRREQAQRAAGDKALQQNVDAGRTQQNAAMLMDSVLRTFNYSATLHESASKTFAAAVEQFAKTVGSRPVTGGLLGAQQRELTPRDYQPQAFRQGGRTTTQPPAAPTQDYLARVAQLESGNRNIANQPRPGQKATSAFGVYQITEDTFRRLAANAPPGSVLRGKTFEQMKGDVNLQTEAMKQLTSSNEALLARRGLSTSDAAKYMAHVMGYGTAAKILEAPGSTPLQRLVPQDWLEKNNLQKYSTAGELRKHFDDITGGKGYQFGGIARGPASGYLAKLHGNEAVVPLPSGKSIPVDFPSNDIENLMNTNVMAMQMAQDLIPRISVLADTQRQGEASTSTLRQEIKSLIQPMRSVVSNLDRSSSPMDTAMFMTMVNGVNAEIVSLQNFLASIRTDISKMPSLLAEIQNTEAQPLAQQQQTAEMRVLAAEVGKEFGNQFRAVVQNLDARTSYNASLLEQLVSLQRSNNQTAQRMLQASTS